MAQDVYNRESAQYKAWSAAEVGKTDLFLGTQRIYYFVGISPINDANISALGALELKNDFGGITVTKIEVPFVRDNASLSLLAGTAKGKIAKRIKSAMGVHNQKQFLARGTINLQTVKTKLGLLVENPQTHGSTKISSPLIATAGGQNIGGFEINTFSGRTIQLINKLYGIDPMSRMSEMKTISALTSAMSEELGLILTPQPISTFLY